MRYIFEQLTLDDKPLLKLSERGVIITRADVENYIANSLSLTETEKKKLLSKMIREAVDWDIRENRFKERWEKFILQVLAHQSEH